MEAWISEVKFKFGTKKALDRLRLAATAEFEKVTRL
jgi:hypothetical protein